MSRWHSYLNSALQILAQYEGQEPFHLFLRKFFSSHKKYGSNDRKQITHLCYCFFRMGKAGRELPVEERVVAGLFLSSTSPNELLEQLKPEWNKKTVLSFADKCTMLSTPCSISKVFPWTGLLSEGIDKEAFILSHFTQPDLFLRLRPGYEGKVKQKLRDAGIEFRIIGENCIALSNSTRVGGLLELNKEVVVQDMNSQRVGELMMVAVRPGRSDRVWDACAASGGKSILAFDLNPKIELTVSDIRQSILTNLEKRFKEAGIENYRSVVADLSSGSALTFSLEEFEFIIADVPCSGSGTWSRTPEQLYYFDEKKIESYTVLQQKIVSTLIPYLRPGGYLLYSTCSVFEKENEELVTFVKEKFDVNLIKMELLRGYNDRADTLFAALFQKPLLPH